MIKQEGLLITVSGDGGQVSPYRNIELRQMGHQLGSKEISEMIDDISNGNLKLVIETEYSFENAPEAFSKAETRHARGKSEVTL